ncbi:hypothetical protein AWB79_01899 [Caballeronia hypogeia]|uniref:Uncharacterized protein n=1 Tax=Caballeronia hypogeia TaxID=1777140 RepID=A0A158A499_9BURK|nr:hypothetical protein [Caballeronia hypogeia]SAK52565.1 hypothetical protein AWB79_01899 [Caballeronia hypogeia]
MDLAGEVALLDKADQDIEQAKARVERQKAMVRRIEASGFDIGDAVMLLNTLHDSLATMQRHRGLIREHVEILKQGG